MLQVEDDIVEVRFVADVVVDERRRQKQGVMSGIVRRIVCREE
jgi:hypothetical protein